MRIENFQYRPDFSAGSSPGDDEVSIKWFGTAAYRIEHRGAVLWIDPFVSRQSFVNLGFKRLEPKRAEIDKYIDRADYIVIGHTHYDHAGDLPYIVPKTGATAFGSESLGALFTAYGLPKEQFRKVTGGDTVEAGPFKISFAKSAHGKLWGRVLADYDIRPDAKPPFKMTDFGCGRVWAVTVEVGGYRIYHHGSGAIVEETLAGTRADMAIIGISSRKSTPRFVYRVVKELQPKVVMPTHYDMFFRPLHKGMRLIPGLDFKKVVREVMEAAPEAALVTLPLLGEYRVKLK